MRFRSITMFVVVISLAHASMAQVAPASYPASMNAGRSAVGERPATASAVITTSSSARITPSSSPRDITPAATAQRTLFHAAATYTVTTTSDSGTGSLRRAITDANTGLAPAVIAFTIPASGVLTIHLRSSLPAITVPVVIDGTTQPGFLQTPIIELDGTQAGTGVNGLTLVGGNSTVRGLVINRFRKGLNGLNGFGIVLDVSGGNVIEGCFIGTDATALVATGNEGSGVGIFGASSLNTVGGSNPKARNIISGNGISGVQIATGNAGANQISGNFLGLDVTGLHALGNKGNGIFCDAPGNRIGGVADSMRNIISGNLSPGIVFNSGGSGNLVQGNFIGSDSTGNAPLPNSNGGVYVENAANNSIGRPSPGVGNLISGDSLTGVYIYGPGASNTLIQGNLIGTNWSGTDSLPNTLHGVVLDNVSGSLIGGNNPGSRNIISGNRGDGVYIYGGSNNYVEGNTIGLSRLADTKLPNKRHGIIVEKSVSNFIIAGDAFTRNFISGNSKSGICLFGPGTSLTSIRGNFIGLAGNGLTPLGNEQQGILVDTSSNNFIGDPSPFMGNTISGNGWEGIVIRGGAAGNHIVSNTIGGDASATSALPNLGGILIDGSPDNIVGGSSWIESNVISGNTQCGIDIRNPGASGNRVLGNVIGTNAGGANTMGNGSHGVLISSPGNVIGGPPRAAGNTISYNKGAGVYVADGNKNTIRCNSIINNLGLGIDLAPAGVSPNDSLDLDIGPNTLQNFPLLDWPETKPGNTVVHGRFKSTPNATFVLDFYSNVTIHPSHFGEGGFFLDSIVVTTDNTGARAFSVSLPGSIGPGTSITATATNAIGNTSEFSQALTGDLDGDGLLDSWETAGWGIDIDADGKTDLDLYSLGARPDHKDLFVEIDAMTGYAPTQAVLDRVRDAFAAAPNSLVKNPDGTDGVSLHNQLDETDLIPSVWASPTRWTSFRDQKAGHFGTVAERGSPDATKLLAAKSLVFRYCIFAKKFDPACNSGAAEGIPGLNFMVTLGGWAVEGGTDYEKAGTYMHELGHSLGLHHGGNSDDLYKPNYLSVMNYTWQTPCPEWQALGMWGLRYSEVALPDLDEYALNEKAGFGVTNEKVQVTLVPFSAPNGTVHWARVQKNTPVDWNGDGDATKTTKDSVDINHLTGAATPGNYLGGAEDWSTLVYGFRETNAFTPPLSLARESAIDSIAEMTPVISAKLHSLPPPKPTGKFSMDGALDTSATLIAANDSLDLYAAVRGNQLYVATRSARSVGADLAIYVAIPPQANRGSAMGKGGQVAAWTAVLTNTSADNAHLWYDRRDSVLTPITVDTAGDYLEGVVDFGLLTGAVPDSIYLAIGKYHSGTGGALIGQVPAGNGDGNIDASEFHALNAPPPLGALWHQQGGMLMATPPGAYRDPHFPLSFDGNTTLLGEHDSVYCYTRAVAGQTQTPGVWNRDPNPIVGTDHVSVNTTYALALSHDGNTALVGSPYDNSYAGAAWVFTRTGNVWTQQGNKIAGPTGTGHRYFGRTGALSGDGNTAAIGNSDGVWIYVRSGGVWTQQGPVINNFGIDTYFTAPLGLSYDGNTLIVSSNGEGGVVFTRSSGVWTLQAKLIGTRTAGEYAFAQFFAALSVDGNTAIVGHPWDNSGVGVVWSFTRSQGVWSLPEKLVPGDELGAGLYGGSVSLSADGNTAVVGGRSDSVTEPSHNLGRGAAWVFERINGYWNQVGHKLNVEHPVNVWGQGNGVSLSPDGGTLIFAANDNTGGPFVFTGNKFVPFFIPNLVASQSANAVRLQWTARCGTSSYGFSAQRHRIGDSVFVDVPGTYTPGGAPAGVMGSYATDDKATLDGRWVYRIRAMTSGGDVGYSPIDSVNVVNGVNAPTGPMEFSLSQNYPNPFNPATTIRYGLPSRTRVSLVVYNILGQVVRTLVDETQEAGYHQVQLRGSTLASGVYIYRITAGGYVRSMKMILLK